MPNHYDNYSILPHTHAPRVLLLHTHTGWTLPRHSATQPPDINAAMNEQLGLSTTVLYCAYDRYQDDARDDQHLVFALENHSENVPLPPNARWIDHTELAHLNLAVPAHRPVLEAWFADIERTHPHPQQLPWTRLGWFDEVTAWINQQLPQLGYQQIAPIEQIKARPWSAVLRVPVRLLKDAWQPGPASPAKPSANPEKPTTAHNLYFKVPTPNFAFELPLTATLAQLAPASFPHLLASDKQHHWMLMQDAGQPLHRGPLDSAHLKEALATFAHIQISLATHIETLKATGCPDQRLHHLPHLYQELLAATPLLLIDQPKGLPRNDYQQLLAYLPQLSEMCQELASYNIPESLQHDDLHNNNILYNGQTYIFIDLAECILAHPFCSLFVALRVAKHSLHYDHDTLQRLTQAYLAPWTRYAPMDRLQQALALAHRLSSLYKALSWYRNLSQLEPNMQWMFKDAPTYYLRLFLGTQA